MADPPVTHEQLALALEQVRRYSAAMSIMVLSASKPDFDEKFDMFVKEDQHLQAFIGALRGE